MNIQNHLDLLGLKVEDRVTGFSGVVSSICFDLFGCIQAAINPGLDKEGKPRDSHWYDVSRLKVVSNEPVMPKPDFAGVSPLAQGLKGPAERPAFSKP